MIFQKIIFRIVEVKNSEFRLKSENFHPCDSPPPPPPPYPRLRYSQQFIISWRSTAAPLSSWDKGYLDKHHAGNYRTASCLNIRSLIMLITNL